MGMRQLARLDANDVLRQQLVVALHLLRRLPAADGAGHVVPAVGGVLVVHRQRILEQLVLLRRPRRAHRTRRHPRPVEPRKEKAEGNPCNRVGCHGEAAVLISRRVVEAKVGSLDAGRE
ncbi:AMP-binding enzyme [Musa troglodytarum]|uniref:AMP-binding enzyme n=1 Tax=Musa troglodytarum TaxID=320322 RepID=A0A9E7KVP5_9LILI|nr:AMP-binding enzyme [Musa troglodytarum]